MSLSMHSLTHRSLLTIGLVNHNLCRTLMAGIAVLSAAGCATNATVQQAPLERDHVFLLQEECSTVVSVLPAALAKLSLKPVGLDADVSQCPLSMIARKGISPFSWGEIVRVSLNRLEGNSTELRVYTDRVVTTNITARGDWSEQVHRALLAQLMDNDN